MGFRGTPVLYYFMSQHRKNSTRRRVTDKERSIEIGHL